MKRCSRCKEWKDRGEFTRGKDGLSSWCKRCKSEYQHEYYLRRSKAKRRNLRYEQRHRVVDGVRQKLCSRCNKWKDEIQFSKDRKRRDGLSDACRKCEGQRVHEYYKNVIKKGGPVKKHYRYEKTHRTLNGVKQKRCRRCRRWKAESEFYRHRRNKDGLDVWCKSCSRKRGMEKTAAGGK